MRFRSGAWAVAGLMVLAGCGGDDVGSSSDESQVTEAIARFEMAIDEQDAEAVCDAWTPRYVESYTGIDTTCEEAFEAGFEGFEDYDLLSPESISITDGETAIVTYGDSMNNLRVVKIDDEWLLDEGIGSNSD